MTSLRGYARNFGQHGIGWQRLADAARKAAQPSPKERLYPTLPSFDDTPSYTPLYPKLPSQDDSSVMLDENGDIIGEVIEEECQAVVVGKEEVSSYFFNIFNRVRLYLNELRDVYFLNNLFS